MENRSKKPNPFNPTGVVPHNLFAGRVNQVEKILEKLTLVKTGTPSSFFFVGDRGIGKTALARLTRYIAINHDPEFYNLNFLSSYYTVERGQTIEDVLQASLNELTDKMSESVIQKLTNHLGSIFKNGKFSIGAFGQSISYENGAQKKREVTVRDQVISILSNIIPAIKEDNDSPKDGVLIVIDEVNNISGIENCAQLIRGIVTTLNVKDIGNIAFILIGYKDTEKAFFRGDESARRNFDIIPLEAMPLEEVVQILEKSFIETEVTWDKDALTESIRFAAGYPHAVQMLGYNVYNADKDGHIDDEDWSMAIGVTALDLQSKEFSTMYSFKGKKGPREQLLDLLVKNNKCMTKTDLKNECKNVHIYREIKKLKEQGGIIEDENGNVCISSQLFSLAILLSNYRKR